MLTTLLYPVHRTASNSWSPHPSSPPATPHSLCRDAERLVCSAETQAEKCFCGFLLSPLTIRPF